jgi:hypothetical protein
MASRIRLLRARTKSVSANRFDDNVMHTVPSCTRGHASIELLHHVYDACSGACASTGIGFACRPSSKEGSCRGFNGARLPWADHACCRVQIGRKKWSPWPCMDVDSSSLRRVFVGARSSAEARCNVA